MAPSQACAFIEDPIAVLNDSEGRILVVNAKLETLLTTDPSSGTASGRLPPMSARSAR